MEASTEINFLSFPKVLLLKLIIFITPSMCARQVSFTCKHRDATFYGYSFIELPTYRMIIAQFSPYERLFPAHPLFLNIPLPLRTISVLTVLPIRLLKMQTFLQEPTLDYSTFISEKNSLPVSIVSVRRSLLVAKRCLDRANKRLITIINHSKSRTNKWKFIVVAADLRKAIRHAPMLVFVVPNKKEKGGQQSKDVVAKYALDMSALLKRLLLDVERDLQIAERSISL